MLQFLLMFLVLIVLLLILVASVAIGRTFGYSQLKKHPHHKLEIATMAESSVFALLALLIAFTFSGAYERFENRKLHLLTEANTFDRALHATDLIAAKYRPELRDNIRKYIVLHLAAYHDLPYMTKVKNDLDQALILEDQIWHTAVIAAEANVNESLGQTFIEAIGDMFDEAHRGVNLTQVHPPVIIFILMIGLAALGGFLIGFDSCENKHKQPIHIVFYILLTAVTIYIIMNLEFPRTGFIRTTYFDQMIVDVKDHTNMQYATLFGY